MKNLTTMTDFVLKQNKIGINYLTAIDICINYANFLKQPLELWMFVPCDKDGNVLEEKSIFNTADEDYIFESEAFDKYQQAKERCLFDGFEFSKTHSNGLDNNLSLFVFPYAKNRLGLTKKNESFRTWFQLFTVEDLVQCDLQLTGDAQKQLQP